MILLKCKKCSTEKECVPGSGGAKIPCICGAINWEVLDDGMVECPNCGHKFYPGQWCCGNRL